MRTRTRTRTRTAMVLWVVALTLGAAGLGGCAGLPTSIPRSGPVVHAQMPPAVSPARASDIDAVPPRSGEPATDVAQGFLDAMQASPIRLDVARRYLTASAATAWDPKRSTITYASKLPARLAGHSTVAITLLEADRLDATGAWQGALPPTQSRLRLRMVREDGQYRITNPPDALVVPATWFAPRFRHAELYFFDPTAHTLVPKAVFVPRGGQFASALVSSLVQGPGSALAGVVRTFLPSALTPGLSVPVNAAGVAEVSLGGNPGLLTPATTGLALAQLAWTLRQDPDIRAIRLSIGGTVMTPSGGAGGDYPVDAASSYDPNGAEATTTLYGLLGSRLVSVDGSDVARVPGPLDRLEPRPRSFAVDVDATRVAAVSAAGRRVVIAPLGGDAVGPGARSRVVARGRDLLRPVWDVGNRLWLVDADRGRAVVSYFHGGQNHRVDVAGVSGRRVAAFLVSRDATRFLAVVRSRYADRLVQGRITVDRRGRVETVGPPRLLSISPAAARIQALCWTSPTTVALSSASTPGQVSEVRSVNLDGSPPDVGALSAAVPDRVEALIGSSLPGVTPYAVTPAGVVDLTTGGPAPLTEQLTELGYAG